MRSVLAILLLFATCTLCSAEPVIGKKLQDATVMLTDGHGHGSGVCFTRDGVTFIWTAAHVGEIWANRDGTYTEVDVVQADKRGKARILRCGDYAVGPDCCLLELTEGDMSGREIEFFAPFNYIELGQEIIHCGTPLDPSNIQLISCGNVSYVDRMFQQRGLVDVPRSVDNIDVTGYPGCSGGPVVDRETGGIVGLLVMGSAPRLAIMEPTRNMYQWAIAHDCLWAFSRQVPMPDVRLQWVSDRSKRLIAEELMDEWDRKLGDVKRPVPVPKPTPEELVNEALEGALEQAIADVLERVSEMIEALKDRCNPDPNDPQGPRVPPTPELPPTDFPPAEDQPPAVDPNIPADSPVTVDEGGNPIIDGVVIEPIGESEIIIDLPAPSGYQLFE